MAAIRSLPFVRTTRGKPVQDTARSRLYVGATLCDASNARHGSDPRTLPRKGWSPMRWTTCGLLVTVLISVPACDSATAPPPQDPAFGVGGGVVASASGGGHYLLSEVLDIKFSFGAVARGDGAAAGQFRQSLTLDGLLVDFHGRVTCLSVDPANARAWIGGVVTRNRSTHPDFQGEIFAVGRDVWFRVLDDGEGGGAVDRTTFLGFEGGGGIITSAEYCETRIWPDDNARTHPVTGGNIQVRP
jgi:hypothetical protein